MGFVFYTSQKSQNKIIWIFFTSFGCEHIHKITIAGEGEHMTSSRILKWVTGSFEILLAFPLLGAAFIIGAAYIPLGVMFVLHIITLVLSIQNQEAKYGSILGIITSLVAWIPMVGWALHIITGILLMVSAAKNDSVVQQQRTY